MEKLIIIKYGEMTTKKDNIGLFLKKLKENVAFVLREEQTTIQYDSGRMFIYCQNNNFDSVLARLQKVFGIHEIIIGYELPNNDIEEIKKNLKELIMTVDFKTFKVETKRSNKKYPLTSPEINHVLGGIVLKTKPDIKVDVHNPEIIIYTEIRLEKSYLYFEKYKGCGGYPVGTLGKGLLMLSGGIDSPVAGYLAMKRGVKIEAIYFESPPHTSFQAKNKVESLARILSTYNQDIKLHIIKFTEIQEAIYKNIPHEYLITIMRRMMYRICAIVASKSNCKIIVNGESIGQVASQTLTSMNAINRVVNIPVIRPLACFDKLEIIEISKKIQTFDTSILPYEDCCTIFVPDHPVINPEIAKCEEYEQLIPYEDLIYQAIRTKEVKIITAHDKKFEDML
ncbi:MAG: tRNA 4-thiouridine(8) synthase ThiI [Bacilli bacterium]|nr:tRNA 4-thiouridine(8) synthase ThiI [Bacilli bacterium]